MMQSKQNESHVRGGASPSEPEVTHSLRRQLVARFVVVVLLATLSAGLAVFFGYRVLTTQAEQQRSALTAEHLARSYAVLHETWTRSAYTTKMHIEHLDLFERGMGEESWRRLRAYFAAQEAELHRFASGVVLDTRHRPVFHFGPDGAEIARRLGQSQQVPGWFRVRRQYLVHVVLHVPLQIGAAGEGSLILLQPMDANTLRLLAPYDSQVLLVHDGAVVASSASDLDLGRAIDIRTEGRRDTPNGPVELRSLDVIDEDALAPRLVLWQPVRQEVPPELVAASTLGLLGLQAVILWLVLGRWTNHQARRMANLSLASEDFGRDPTISPTIERALTQVAVTPDEVGHVARANRALMENVVRHNQEHFAYLQTLDILEEGVVELGPAGEFRRTSPGWLRLAGEVSGESFGSVLHPGDQADFQSQLDQLFSGEKDSMNGRVRMLRGDREVWIEYRFIPGDVQEGRVRDVRGVLRDITQSYQLEKHVTHMALHDALTSLPNRVLLEDRCKMALRSAERNGLMVALGFLDLDHFKHVNDQFGHKTGDELLVALAAAMRKCLRAGDTLARWGGDEFVVLLTELGSQTDAEEAIGKLVGVCQAPIRLGDTEFNATFSMGVALFPSDAKTVETLLSQADRAMFAAKQQGRNAVRFFAEIAEREEDRKALYIQSRLATAIREGKIETWFQPIVDAKTRRVVSCEALARWQDETYGWVSPATFVPMAENLGLIREMGQQVWKQAIDNLHRWRQRGLDMRISVNVSRRQLFTPTFTADLLEDLDRLAIPVSVVDLEITESVAMEDAEHTEKRLAELTEAGFGIAIDDFGTGFSSLSQLHDMPASKIKIDISFVRRARTEQGSQLIQAVVKIASAFDLQTVAEGVESEDIADVLTGQGVSLLQGYHFGKPMSAADFEAMLRVPTEPDVPTR